VALAADGVSVAVHAEQQKLNLGVFTVEAWVNPDALAANSVIVKKASGTATAYSLTVDAAGNVIFRVNNQTLTSVPAAAIAAGAWSHIAATCDGASLTLTVTKADPAQPAVADATVSYTKSAALTTTLAVGDGALSIAGAGSAYVGLIDEVRIWSTARSADQLAANRRATLAGDEAGLAAYYPFDDAGTTVEDFTARNDFDVDGVRVGGQRKQRVEEYT